MFKIITVITHVVLMLLCAGCSTDNMYDFDITVSNPSYHNVIIRYELREETHVVLDIYDTMGTHVITLIDETQLPGIYKETWNGTNKHNIPSTDGMYVLRYELDNFHGNKQSGSRKFLFWY